MLVFETKADLKTLLNGVTNYRVDEENNVFFKDKLVGLIFVKHDLYRFLEKNGVKWQDYLSKKLLPDDSIYVILNNTFFVIECKYQQVGGSVDEKLQTCDFKKKQYKRLLASLNFEVEYIYILNDWFKNPETRIDMYKMFEQIGKHKVRVKLPKKNIKPVEFNLSDISEFNDEYVHGALGYKLIEKICMQNYNGLSRTVQDFNRGGQPQIIMDVLYKTGAKQGCYSDLGKNGLHMFVERSKGNTVLIPRAEYQETSQNRNIGLWGGHCYSSQNGNFFNPINSIEEVYYPKQENIYQIVYRQ